jgi:type II secretory pathway pseudopilin PulG
VLEIAVTLGVVALVASSVGFSISARMRDGRLTAALTRLDTLREAVQIARARGGAWPASLDDLRGTLLPAAYALTSNFGTPYTLATDGMAATISVDIPLDVTDEHDFATWIERVPAAPGHTRLVAHLRTSAALAPVGLERRRVARE